MRKNALKILSMVLMLMLMATSLAFAGVPSDVTGQDYEGAVQVLMDRGIITGDEDGLFHPDEYLSRAQACAIVVRAIDPPTAKLFGTATQSVPDSGFTDMAGHKWAEPYVNYAVSNGITLGVGNNKFNPKGQVKSAELMTFVLRAAGYSDAKLGGTWPDNYVDKAKELDLGAGLGTEIPELINKWMTAQFTFNALDLIDKAQKDQPIASGGVILTGLTYLTGSFDTNIKTFDGKPLDKNIEVYKYEVKKNYKKDMVLSKTKADYIPVDFNIYKNVTTPAWYLMSGGKVTQIILPFDVGFTGMVYGLINSKNMAINGAGESVDSLATWTAMMELDWLCKKDITLPILTKGSGEIYEMASSNGEINNIALATGTKKGRHFEEITSAGGAFVEVAAVSKGVLALTGPSISYIEVSDTATVYVVQSDDTYTTGSLSSIKKGKTVRLYDISDDKNVNVDIVIVK